MEQLKNSVPNDSFELLSEDSIRFNKLRQIHFKKSKLRDVSYLDLLKDGSKFFTFDLPINIGELFVRKEETPNLWLLEFPLLIKAEAQLNVKNRHSYNPDETSVKKNYQRWIVAKEIYQKKIFSSLVSKLISNSQGTSSFIELIYFSIILIYDEYNRNLDEAIVQLQTAKSLLNDSVLETQQKELFNYYIELYTSYAHMDLGNYEHAANHLSIALEHNHYGITAKFYLAYCFAIMNHRDAGDNLIKEIFEYDLTRLKYALSTSSNSLFNYLISNNAFTNIFYYAEFSAYSQTSEMLLRVDNRISLNMVLELKNKLDDLQPCHLETYYSKEIFDSMQFFRKLTEDHKSNGNTFFLMALNLVTEKFDSMIESIKKNVKTICFKGYDADMKRYDGYMEENSLLMNQMTKELADFKEEIKRKLSSAIQKVEEYTKDSIHEIETSLQNLEVEKSTNPIISFKTSMGYCLFISILIFIIGGFAGYFNNSAFFNDDFNTLIKLILSTGSKWAALTFVIGFFISAAFSLLVALEKGKKKQILHRNSIILQKEKEIAISELKKEAEEKQTSLSEKFNERIEAHSRKIERLRIEKEDRRKHLELEAENTYNPIFEKLDKLYFSFTAK